MSLEDFLLSPALGEEMYARYKENPKGIDPSVKKLFDELGTSIKRPDLPRLTPPDVMDAEREAGQTARVENLFDYFRKNGFSFAEVNPLQQAPSPNPKETLSALGFREIEIEGLFPSLGLFEEPLMPLLDIFNRLKERWGGRIGFEFYGSAKPELSLELIHIMEDPNFSISLSLEQKQKIIEGLSKADIFETFVHTRYTGQKRFSIEGAETLIPMIELGLQKAMEIGIQEVWMGMAHRGRLNVLSNILGKSAQEIFSEFDEGYIPDQFEGSGDVKYHKGFQTVLTGKEGAKLALFLASNPSHLESIDPVLLGQTRARQEARPIMQGRKKVVPILIHGDGSLSGQGVVYETLQMQKLRAYETGGTIHIVINNQIGFTTLPEDLKSTPYCTDIAKTFGFPVFRVSVEDPEAAVWVFQLALTLRQKFQEDIFIDLIGWRKWGHNESDEPAFTQPLLYQVIRKKKSPRETYREILKQEGRIESVLADRMEEEFRKGLHQARETLAIEPKDLKFQSSKKEPYYPASIPTKVSLAVMERAAEKIGAIPDSFTLHPKVESLMKERRNAILSPNMRKIDWGCAEALAYATLLIEGKAIRLVGQDVERGTFSHRHLKVFDQINQRGASPFDDKGENEGTFEIYNSHLSEMAALGFEYGYSLQKENGLTLWEAQFGDFANGAQVIIDQYIAAGEEKWGQKSALTLLLPHGYEGQGPEHSSARIERYLTLAAHRNLRICNPTTPAQFFHLLRRQALQEEKKPLIVFTPKALLRYNQCASSPEEFIDGNFCEILQDPKAPGTCKTLVLCSGKVYYDLDTAREKYLSSGVALIRIEQLYPLYEEALRHVAQQYKEAQKVLFVQEEPANMGPWSYLGRELERIFARKIEVVSREEAASSAAGHVAFHKYEQKEIFSKVFDKPEEGLYEIQGYLRA